MYDHPGASDCAFINELSVRSALAAMVYSTTPPDTRTLEALRLVDVRLQNSPAPQGLHLRRYTLQLILTEIITNQLHAHRTVLGLPPPAQQDTYQTVVAQIARDGLTSNIELISWSWLYYRYVRVDLDIKWPVFSENVLAGDRTLRRYQQHGIRRLMERLITLEFEARQG
jgi:hypothetical protein